MTLFAYVDAAWNISNLQPQFIAIFSMQSSLIISFITGV